MAQLQRVEGKTELKCPAEKFFNDWTQSIYLLPEVCPDKFTKIELHEGTNWHSVGAVKTWHYIHDGRHEFVVKKVTAVDEKSKYVNYDYVDGVFLRKYFNSFKSSIQAIPKGDGGCFVKINIECENKTQDAPDANIYVHFLLGLAKGMGDRLCIA